MSKTPAKSAKSRTVKPAKAARKPVAPKKATAKKPTTVAKPAARPTSRKAAKPAPAAPKKAAAKPSKPGAKAAVATKAPKTSKSPAARGAATKPVKKSSPAVSVSKSSLPAAAKPSAKPSVKSAAKAPVATAVKAAPATAQVKQPPARPAAAKAQPAPAAPTAVATSTTAAAASRFADRFSPPRPPVRGAGLREPEPTRPAVKIDPKLANAWKTKAGKDLSDDELLAMPEAEYMNEKQLEFFRARLQALKDDLLSNAGETTEHLREDTSIVPDPADRATIEEEHALELRTRDRERKLLKKITQSLARLDSGEYGFCDETGEPIGLARLLARPTATLSLEAQQRREMKQKMFGD